MKGSLITLLTIAILVGTVVLATAQDTVSVPLGTVNVTATLPPPPPPPPFTQQVSQAVTATVTLNGVKYTVTGTLAGVLTFTPAAAATPVTVPTSPPSTTPNSSWPMSIIGFRDASRNWMSGPDPLAAAGATLFIDGIGFGAATGTVTYAGVVPVKVQKWTDTEITISAPGYSGTTAAQTTDVRRPDGAHAVTLSFGISAPPKGP